MFFFLSKIIWLIFTPSNLIGLVFLAGLLTSLFFKRFSRYLLACSAFMFVLIGFFPIGYNTVHYWETKYPYSSQTPVKVDGIIVLGGAIETKLSIEHEQISLNESAERLTYFSALAKQFPEAKLIFSGGSGNLSDQEHKEASFARDFLKSLGVPIEKVLFEDQSRNTFENAVFSKNMADPKSDEIWLLVTSAYHMPRSMAVFKGQGWDVIPVSVDFKTGQSYKIVPTELAILKNFQLFDIGLRETIGMIAYDLWGKIP